MPGFSRRSMLKRGVAGAAAFGLSGGAGIAQARGGSRRHGRRAIERLPDVRPQNTALNGIWEIPTFQEVIDIAKAHGVGIYPETKHPTFFAGLGFVHDRPMLDTLRRNGLDRPGAKVFIQSFEVSNLQRLNRETRLPLIQLIDVKGAPADFVAAGDPRTYNDLVTPAGLRQIA